MANEKVLVVEDDSDLSGIMGDYLKKEGFEVKRAFNGQDGIDFAKGFAPSLIILDIMLPKVDGIEVCRMIRQTSYAPIIIISAKSSDADKLVSLGVGADDYLTKPFSLTELIARVKSHIRRFTSFGADAPAATQKRVFGTLTIDPESYTVTVEGREIPLTAKEFKLIDYLSAHPSQVFSKEQLMNNVWGYPEYMDDNTIVVYIGRLREKLSKAGVLCIKTVWGVGYKWEM
jgi:DNA-binding response OmpR family regulator